MRKISELTVADFPGVDEKKFAAWREAVSGHQAVAPVGVIGIAVGIASLYFVGGFVGVGIFFIVSLSGLYVVLPKRRKALKLQKEAGITNDALLKVQCSSSARSVEPTENSGNAKKGMHTLIVVCSKCHHEFEIHLESEHKHTFVKCPKCDGPVSSQYDQKGKRYSPAQAAAEALIKRHINK